MKFKYLSFFTLTVVFILCFSLPVFALYNLSVPFDEPFFTFDTSKSYIYKNSVATSLAGDFEDGILTVFNSSSYDAIQPVFKYYNGSSPSGVWKSGEVLSFDITISSESPVESHSSEPEDYFVTLTSASGVSLQATATYVSVSEVTSYGSKIIISYDTLLSNDIDFYLQNSYWSFYLSCGSQRDTDARVNKLSFSDVRVYSYDGATNQAVNKITESIEVQTDEILHSWEGDNSLQTDMNDMADELDDAESNVFGDKSQEEALGEVESVLDTDTLPDPNNTGSLQVMRFFNKTLDTLGTGVLSIITMSCAIGLALTILGRSY